MSERLEQKFAGISLNKPSATIKGQQPDEIEETLHNQVMSNTCPICFELFLPPNNQPFILFPCGHTFCKVCINSYAKQKNKCPFCRQQIKSMAPNISLQNLILSANERKEEVIKKLKTKQDQIIRNGGFNQIQDQPPNQLENNVNVQKYMNDYRLLDIRCGVLEEERMDYMLQLNYIKDRIKAKEKALNTLQLEKEDCLIRLRKVQQELDLIKDFEERESIEMENLRQDRIKQEQSVKFIEDSLGPLKIEKEKAKMMVQTIAPHLVSELQ